VPCGKGNLLSWCVAHWFRPLGKLLVFSELRRGRQLVPRSTAPGEIAEGAPLPVRYRGGGRCDDGREIHSFGQLERGEVVGGCDMGMSMGRESAVAGAKAGLTGARHSLSNVVCRMSQPNRPEFREQKVSSWREGDGLLRGS
jgi:hypothetical protein